jgi:hypothetical protein
MSHVTTATTPSANGTAHTRSSSGDSLGSIDTAPTPTPPERDVWSPYASFLPSIADAEGDDDQPHPGEEQRLQPVQEEAEEAEEAEEQEEREQDDVTTPGTPGTPGAPPILSTPSTADLASHWDGDSRNSQSPSYGTSFARSRPRSEGSDFYYDAGGRGEMQMEGGAQDEANSKWSSREFEQGPGAERAGNGSGVTREGKKKPFRWFGSKGYVARSYPCPYPAY